jgi:hypothetical protein
VAATSFKRRDEAHGWMGMKFQRRPRTEPSQIIIHVRLLDKENLLQQEALGIMGVNLLYGAFFHYGTHFITSLLDGLTAQRVEVDLIEFSGPASGDDRREDARAYKKRKVSRREQRTVTKSLLSRFASISVETYTILAQRRRVLIANPIGFGHLLGQVRQIFENARHHVAQPLGHHSRVVDT